MAANLNPDGGLGHKVRSNAASRHQQILQIRTDQAIIWNLIPRSVRTPFRQIVLEQPLSPMDVYGIVALADAPVKLPLTQHVRGRQLIFRVDSPALPDAGYQGDIGDVRIVEAREIFLVEHELSVDESLPPHHKFRQLQGIAGIGQVKKFRIVKGHCIPSPRYLEHGPVCHALFFQIP